MWVVFLLVYCRIRDKKKTFTTTETVVKVLLLRTNPGDETRTDGMCCAFALATP